LCQEFLSRGKELYARERRITLLRKPAPKGLPCELRGFTELPHGKLTAGTVEASDATRRPRTKSAVKARLFGKITGSCSRTGLGSRWTTTTSINATSMRCSNAPSCRSPSIVRATLLRSNNVNPKIVQEMLGHAIITQMMDTYSHVLPRHAGRGCRPDGERPVLSPKGYRRFSLDSLTAAYLSATFRNISSKVRRL
jgi:integrase